MTIDDVPADTRRLRISTRIAGEMQAEQNGEPEKRQFQLKLPADKQGPADLEVTALDDGGCWLASASLHEASVGDALRNFVVRTLRLTPVAGAPACVLRVQYEQALGRIEATPAGLPCLGWAEPDCLAQFPRGMRVTLVPHGNSPFSPGSWLDECAGSTTCAVDMKASQTRKLSFTCSGQGWCSVTSPTMQTLRSIWGSSSSNIWVVGDAGTVLRFDGKRWMASTLQTDVDLYGVTGTADGNNVWVVGQRGSIFHWNASRGWEPNHSNVTEDLRSVWAIEQAVWAIGDNGVRLRLAQTDPEKRWASPRENSPLSLTNNLYGGIGFMNGMSEQGLLVGSGGLLVYFYDTTAFGWSFGQYKLSTTDQMNSVWTSGDGGAWAVGNAGSIVRYALGKETRIPMSGNDQPDLRSIWGSQSAGLWVVGAHGTILRLHNDPLMFASVASGSTADLFGLWGCGPSDLWAVGQGGTLLHFTQPGGGRESASPRVGCDGGGSP